MKSVDLEEIRRLNQIERDELALCKQYFPKASWSGMIQRYKGTFVSGRLRVKIHVEQQDGDNWFAGAAIEGHSHWLVRTKAVGIENSLAYLKARLGQMVAALSGMIE